MYRNQFLKSTIRRNKGYSQVPWLNAHSSSQQLRICSGIFHGFISHSIFWTQTLIFEQCSSFSHIFQSSQLEEQTRKSLKNSQLTPNRQYWPYQPYCNIKIWSHSGAKPASKQQNKCWNSPTLQHLILVKDVNKNSFS